LEHFLIYYQAYPLQIYYQAQCINHEIIGYIARHWPIFNDILPGISVTDILPGSFAKYSNKIEKKIPVYLISIQKLINY